MTNDPEYNRLFWHSRRGMRELDLLLIPFLEQAFHSLEDDDKLRYRKLLTAEDTELYAWFMQRERPEDPELARMVDLILQHAKPH